MPRLAEILASREITCVDAGASGGLNELQKLRKFINLYSFEPLPDSYSSLKNNLSFAARFRKQEVFPLALHSANGPADLNIGGRSSMSSLLEFDEHAFDKHFGYKAGSARWKKMLISNQTISVNTITLDKWSDENKISSIDFLKLDTQGTELEILKGAVNLLDNHKISVIKTEFSNFPVYKNQCLYPQIDSFLGSKGFELVDCIFYPDTVYQAGSSSVNENRKLREVPPIGAGGDAVYILRNEFLNSGNALKAGIILGSMGYFGQACEILVKEGFDKHDAEELLLEIAPKKSFKKKVKEFIPPVLIKLFRAINNKI